ncbi:mediator complex subunit med6 [Cystoisospora suis]|uniref:Mediator complex subunit med6 n=1 Tax=Cystoisospora suis TaxID=483139 RepID=A0A2C6KWK3_9APIC|nr:mediator complex subunit med6 [Cystoisospora suis]
MQLSAVAQPGSSLPQAASAVPPFPAYTPGALQRECALEFVDWRWLCGHCLDSDAAALEYFYLSPFYVEVGSYSLNERLRRGEDHRTLAQEQGLLFSVTYSNLAVLRAQASAAGKEACPPGEPSSAQEESGNRSDDPRDGQGKAQREATELTAGNESDSAGEPQSGGAASNAEGLGDFAARCTYYNNNALFHITLMRREPGMHGAVLTTTLRVYTVIGGKIYRVPPLVDVLNQKMASAMRHLENCFDLLQGRLATWSLAAGNSWWSSIEGDKADENRKRRASREKKSELVQYGKEERKEEQENSEREPASSARTKLQPSEETWDEDGCDITEVFRKTGCESAARVMLEEQKLLSAEVSMLMARRKALEEHWGLARETEAKLTAAMEKKTAEYKKLLTAQLKSLTESRQLRFFQAQRRQAEERMREREQRSEREALVREEAWRHGG